MERVERQVIHLAEYVDDRTSMIAGIEFFDCELVGPAVVAPLQDVTFSNSTFDAPPEAMFIPIDTDRYLVGVIGLTDVRIERCRLRNVGIAGPADLAERFFGSGWDDVDARARSARES